MNNKEIQIIEGIECYEENGVAYLKLETVARGLGFTTTAASGNDVVRWNTVYNYLRDLGTVAGSCNGSYRENCPEYIPENVFYRMAMKAKNAMAEAFQAKVADEIIPAIRRTGFYAVIPQDYPSALRALADEVEKNRELAQENAEQKMMLAEYSPKASYYDIVLQTPDVVSISKIAKDYGKSAQWLNNYLNEKSVQYKQGGIWLLYQKFAELGYTKSKTALVIDQNGKQHSKMSTYWTQKGRLFIYDLLKQDGILPCIEKTA